MTLPILPLTLAQAVTITDPNEAETLALHMHEIVQASLPTAIDGRADLHIQGSRRRGTAVEEKPDLDLIAEAHVNRRGYEADADLLVTWKNSVEQQLVSRWGGHCRKAVKWCTACSGCDPLRPNAHLPPL